MSKQIRMSVQTRKNWLIDVAVFLGGLLAALTGVYFLFLPSGGYQGGRNPTYGITVLFDRHTWGDLHTWGGVLMIAAVAIHFAIHWRWVVMMSRKVVNAVRARGSNLSKGAKFNVAVDALIALSFLVCAISGIYFLFAPSGGFQGGRNPGWDPGFLVSRTAWDLIHTWSGVVMIVAAVVHLAIHWRWVKNVTVRFFLSLWPQPKAGSAAPAGKTTLASSNLS
jgi:cytochrome b subunit of formate dehydrogenase